MPDDVDLLIGLKEGLSYGPVRAIKDNAKQIRRQQRRGTSTTVNQTRVVLGGSGSGSGGSDHGALTGLTDDDHTQYVLESAHASESYDAGHHAKSHAHKTSDASGAIKYTKSVWIESPTSTEDAGLFVASEAITITNVYTYVKAGTSVTFNVAHGTNPTSTANLWASDQVANTLTSVQTHSTSYNDATVAAGEAVKLTTSAVSGSVTGILVTIEYTKD